MEYIKAEQQGGTLVLTIDRPHCMNALNNGVYEEIIACLEDAAGRDDIKVVILTGAGEKAFAAGADIAQMVHQNAMDGRHLSELCHRAAHLLETMRQVTIAAINGYAFGGGCEITLACDIRLASENAKFALPEVGLGIIPGGGGTQRLSRIIGVGRAKEMIFTGDAIDAQEAYRIGLVNHVLPQKELMPYALAMAEKIGSKASYAVSLAKSAIYTSQSTDLPNGCLREMDLLGLVFATHDKQEGMEAFLAHRNPEFKDF